MSLVILPESNHPKSPAFYHRPRDFRASRYQEVPSMASLMGPVEEGWNLRDRLIGVGLVPCVTKAVFFQAKKDGQNHAKSLLGSKIVVLGQQNMTIKRTKTSCG